MSQNAPTQEPSQVPSQIPAPGSSPQPPGWGQPPSGYGTPQQPGWAQPSYGVQQPGRGQPAYGQPAYGQPAYGQPQQPSWGQPSPHTARPPANWIHPYEAHRARGGDGAKALAIVGIILGLIALVFFPPLFGLAGIVLGAIAWGKGETGLGVTAVIVSGVCMFLGFVLGLLMFALV